MLIKVRVTSNARQDKVTKTGENSMEIAVRAPTQENRANVRVKELLSAYYCIPASAICIINGHRRPHKLIQLLRQPSYEA